MRTILSVLLMLSLCSVLIMDSPLFSVHSQTTNTPSAKNKGLSKHDRELLAQLRADGKGSATLLLSVNPESTAVIAQQLQSLGTSLRYRDDDLGYLRIDAGFDKVNTIVDLNGVQTVQVNEKLSVEKPRRLETGMGEPTSLSIPPPDANTPAENPYLATRDIGAPQFVAAHPTFDGRGVKIGILDSGIDLLAPELQFALAKDGSTVRKIVDWQNTNDPLTSGDPSWINMQTKVTVVGGSFSANAVTYVGVAADGDYRFGLLDESRFGPDSEYVVDCGPDLNRNGICNESFAVLWRLSDNRVWVDTNADHSFSGEPGLTDYRLNNDIAIFGVDNAATPLRESVPFTVETDNRNKFVNIGIVAGGHGTFVAGIAAGRNYFGGSINGSAPNAQIVSACWSGPDGVGSLQSLIEGMIFLAKTARVDVMSISVGSDISLNNGSDTWSVMTDRLVEQYNLPIFISAGNDGPGVNSISVPSIAQRAFAVGAYADKEALLYNLGTDALRDEYVEGYSSRGPREDGLLKPDIVAPSELLSTWPAWEEGNFPGNAYLLPAGYIIGGGTSASAPCAAGGAALLMSAAEQSHLQFNPGQLKQAIRSTTHYLNDFKAHEQGNGLLQVGAAWELLRDGIETVDISSNAPVNTVLSPGFPTPNRGFGIYDREGWQAGQSASRGIFFLRSSGSPKPITYNLSWKGNDGTFVTDASITLPRGFSVPLSVQINPATTGVHSAILNVDDPATEGIDYQILNTIIASERFSAAGGYQIQHSVGIQRGDNHSFFLKAPANALGLKLTITGLDGVVRPARYFPTGLPFFSDLNGLLNNTSWTRVVQGPGVWEISVFTSTDSAVDPATYTFTASMLGPLNITPSSWVIDPANVGTSYTQAFTFTNVFGPFNGRATGSILGAAFSERPTLNAGGSQLAYEVQVPAGSSSIFARINNASDPNADVDLYLFDCTGSTCVLAARSVSPTANELVARSNPTPGKWLVIVDPFRVPAGSTQLDYVDLYANLSYGTVSVPDSTTLRPNGAFWTRTATATALTTPPAGRSFKGFVGVIGEGIQFNAVDVDLKHVQ